ncbi:MAG TPA: hypothetical protein VGD65_00475 [Chryseosolibacter sp.]
MKVERKIYKGIEYVLVAELPQMQREQLLQTLSPDHFIKILIEGAVVSQCLQYKDYSLWFDNVYAAKLQPVKEKVTDVVTVPAARLALNKA